MTTKKLLIKGLDADATEAGIRSWLDRFGPVKRVEIIREGHPTNPSVLVEMDLDDKAAEYLVAQISCFYHSSAAVSAQLLNP